MVRVVISIEVTNHWVLHQLEVKNTFLDGHLSETIFMEQPHRFVGLQHPNYVCRLNKALYGLKQAPRAWFQRLSSYYLKQGFQCTQFDTSLFVFIKDLVVYIFSSMLTTPFLPRVTRLLFLVSLKGYIGSFQSKTLAC